MRKSRDSGNLSIDFLAGFTIFIVAFVWVISLVPGLLIDLQAFTIDYDAVAYRTGVILVEDPGASMYTTSAWEVPIQGTNYNPAVVERFGLAVSRDTPNILSLDKVNRFFDDTRFNASNYRNKAIFGDYPYHYNISFRYLDDVTSRSIGDPLPEGYGYIRRFVKVKTMSNMTVDGAETVLVGMTQVNRLYNEKYVQGDNTTATHIVSILLDNNNLTGRASVIKDPAFQIYPAQDSLMINLTFLRNTMWNSTLANHVRTDTCFNILLNDQNVTLSDGSPPLIYLRNVTIDENPVHLTNTFSPVAQNVSIVLNTTIDPERRDIEWNSDQVRLDLKFTLEPNGASYPSICLCPQTGAPEILKCHGSTFLNSTVKSLSDHPFDYIYTSDRVTLPRLRDGMLEVAIW